MNISLIIGIIILFLYLICYIIFHKDIKRANKNFLYISFFVLFIVLAIRKPYSDMNNYIEYFHYLNESTYSQFLRFDLEFLYKVLNILIGKICIDDRLFIYILSFLTLIGPMYIIKKYSKNYLISILLYISIGSFYMNFFIIRQALAISLLMFSVKYIEEKKLMKFIFLVFIASLFHNTALIFLPLYVLSKMKIDNKNLIVCLLFLMIIILLKDVITTFLMNFSSDYTSYVNSEFDVKNTGINRLIMFSIMIIFCRLFYKNYKDDKIINLLLCTSFFMICMQINATSSALFARVANYFTFSLYILVPNVIYNLKKRHTKMIMKLVIIVLFFLYVILWNPIEGYLIN